MDSHEVHIYTDGGFRPSLNKTAAAAFMVINQDQVIYKKSYLLKFDPSNNRAELKAVIYALIWLRDNPKSKCTLYTDSRYIEQGLNSWIKYWIRHDWTGKSGKPVLNKDLWEELYNLFISLSVKISWVPAHSGVKYNVAVDELCNEVFKNYKETL